MHLGPLSSDYKSYAKHILTFFNDAIEAYTSDQYTLQTFLAWSDSNKGLQSIAKRLIDGKRTVFIFGDKFTPANSRAKGYLRSNVRGIVEILQRDENCTVILEDEFRTTKLCSFCFNRLYDGTKCGRTNTKYRYKVCRMCHPADDAILAQNSIESKKPNRQLAIDRFEARANNINPNRVSKERRYNIIRWADYPNGRTVTFNRDINAARNIYYRGMCVPYKN